MTAKYIITNSKELLDTIKIGASLEWDRLIEGMAIFDASPIFAAKVNLPEGTVVEMDTMINLLVVLSEADVVSVISHDSPQSDTAAWKLYSQFSAKPFNMGQFYSKANTVSAVKDINKDYGRLFAEISG